jgi:hypothetical protein
MLTDLADSTKLLNFRQKMGIMKTMKLGRGMNDEQAEVDKVEEGN